MNDLQHSITRQANLAEIGTAVTYARQRCRSTRALIDSACDVSTPITTRS